MNAAVAFMSMACASLRAPLKTVFIRLLVGLLQPLVQGAVSWLLLKRTDWCLKKAGLGHEPPQM